MNDNDIRQPEKVAIPVNGLSVERCVPIWHPRFKKDVGELREDGEMIKGLENGTFEEGLKALVSPEKRWIGSDLITTFGT